MYYFPIGLINVARASFEPGRCYFEKGLVRYEHIVRKEMISLQDIDFTIEMQTQCMYTRRHRN